MKIYSWNVNGLRAILKKNFLDFVSEKKPDILCIQETKISRDIVGEIDLPFKYKFFSCADKKGYSGTAILSNKEPFDVRLVALKDHSEEGRITLADFGEFNLVCVYVPNSQDGLKRLKYRRVWNADFCEFLSGLQKPLIVCGDMNVAHQEIDLARPKDNHFSAGFTDEEREDFSALLKNAKLTDIWRVRNPTCADKYSWWSYRGGARTRNVGWRIDYFLVSAGDEALIKNCDICDSVEGSDHCPIMIEL